MDRFRSRQDAGLPMGRQVRSSTDVFKVRNAVRDDAAQIARIYGIHVSEGAGSFEEVAPTSEEISRRMKNVNVHGLPWKAAEARGGVVGYCYASPYHSRSAYKFTVQSSVYVDGQWQGRGIGLALLNAVIASCKQLGYCQLMAAVGDSHNEAALRLHARAGFRTIGHAVRVGVKFGRWTDVVYLQRALRDACDPPPDSDPIGYVPPTDQTGP
jgi:phosphinothricin acetyltransferase